MEKNAANKVPLNRDRFFEARKLRDCSIKKLGMENEIGRSEKTILRYIGQGEITEEILDRIGRYLDVDPAYLSGEYDRQIDSIDNADIRKTLKAQLKAAKFPYLMKQQRKAGLYDSYFENILIIHGISIEQFKEKPFEEQRRLQLDIEDAIVRVIAKHFTQDAKGQKNLPGLQRIWVEIECYDPDEPNDTI